MKVLQCSIGSAFTIKYIGKVQPQRLDALLLYALSHHTVVIQARCKFWMKALISASDRGSLSLWLLPSRILFTSLEFPEYLRYCSTKSPSMNPYIPVESDRPGLLTGVLHLQADHK